MAEEAVLQQSISNLGRTLSAQLQGINNTTMTFREAAVQQNRSVSNVVKDLFSAVSSQRREQADTNEYLGQAIRDVEQSSNENAKANDATRDELDKVLSAEYKSLSELSEIKSYLKDIDDHTTGSVLSNLFENIFTGTAFSSALSTAFGLAVGGLAGYGLAGGGGAGGAGGGQLGPGVGESGSSSEAMSFFQSKGWTKEQSAGIVGNLQAESGKSLRTNAVGDNRQAYGIAQWHPDRQRDFERVMGIPIRQSNFKQQLEFVNWELNNTEKRAGQMLKSASTPIEAARAIDYGYERSTHQHLGERMANAVALSKGKGEATATTPVTPMQNTSTTINLPPTAPDAGRQALPSGLPSPSRGNTQAFGAALPQNDIVALGHTLQSQGFRVSEHPAFGGVKGATPEKPWGVHSPTGGHGDGTAIDVNIGTGNTEARDPAMGAKFDKLADQLRASGYQVIWRAPGHYDHLHARMLKGGQSPVGPTTPTTPTGPEAPATGTPTEQSAPTVDPRLYSTNPADIISAGRDMMRTQLQAEGLTMPGVNAPGFSTGALSGALPITSFGGAGMLNMLSNLFGSEGGSMMQNESSNILQQLQPQIDSTQQIQNAAIQDKVASAMQARTPEPEKRDTEPSQFMQSHERHFPQGSFSDYNTDNHLYPEWASMLYDVYGKFTGSKGGNIKTSLA